MKKRAKKQRLSPLEDAVMKVLWRKESATADDVRQALVGQHEIKDSTVRTVLRRLEEKGYAEHDQDGRTYVYRPKVAQQNVVSDAVRGIIDRFCSGSVENLLVGLVDDRVISPEKLRELADQIDATEVKQVKKRKKKT